MGITVTLNKDKILKGIYTEEYLADCHTIESIYAIRKLKALVESLSMGSIEIDKETSTQVFSKKYDIWFMRDEIIEI